MKRFTFFIEEHDTQCSVVKYYKIHKYGRNINHAFHRAEVFMNTKFSTGLDYEYKLLTLNQFNQLKSRNGWQDILSLLPLPIWLACVAIAGTAKLVQKIIPQK